MGKHTAGPWVEFVHRDPTGKIELIAIMPAGRPGDIASVAVDKPEDEANASLIAAAPDLLEALIAARDYMDAFGRDADMAPTMDKIEAALTRATQATPEDSHGE